MHPAARNAGFTLIELVIVIVLLGIVSVVVAGFISGPVRAYVDQARRTALVDTADVALRRISREIRGALPNSVRVRQTGNVSYLELIPLVAGGRYRDAPEAPGFADPEDWLDFSSMDSAFALFGRFDGIPASLADHHLVIYNDGGVGADAYSSAGVITPSGTAIGVTTTSGVDYVTLTPGFQFSHRSPAQRIYLVQGPISFECNADSGELWLWRGYGFAPSQPDGGTLAATAGSSRALLAENVARCEFEYLPGALQRAGLVTLVIYIGRDGEEVRLLHQVHALNSP